MGLFMIFSSICYAMIGAFLQLQRTGLCSPAVTIIVVFVVIKRCFDKNVVKQGKMQN